MDIRFEKFNAAAAGHQEAVGLLGDWSRDSAAMIPITAAALDGHTLGVLAFRDASAELVGYAGITMRYTGRLVEFGGLVVNPAFRRCGAGQDLAKYVLRTARETEPDVEQIIAFANDKSLGLFRKLGAKILGQPERDALSQDVWKLCFSCPNKSAGFCLERPNCCDTVVDLTGIAKADSQDIAILEHR